MKMTKYKYVRNKNGGTLKNYLNDFKPYDIEISCSQNLMEGIGFAELLEELKNSQPAPQSVLLCGIRTVKEVLEILSANKDSIEVLDLFKCPDLEDFSFLEELPRLKILNIYWNSKVTKLFDASRMGNLQKFEITDCNKVVDFSGLEYSNIEYLGLFGCNGCSSFTSKLDCGDLSFLKSMHKLNELRLDIMKTRTDDVYLKAIAEAKTLEQFFIKDSFFTFEQFAWLSAHLPNVKKDLEPCTYFISWRERGAEIVPEVDEYWVIGRHKTYVKKQKAIRYLNAYNALRAEYANQPEPPSSDLKVQI